MIAVDTNILVYAHRSEFPQHEAARTAIQELAEGAAAWALPVFVLGEFLRIATHLRVLEPPSDERVVVAVLDHLLESPTVRVLSPGERYWDLLRETVLSGVRGNAVHDAAIAAVCLEAGATEVLTEDRDFDRFAGITVRRLR
ncbi:MAG: TA system VapC family ribonuclease toxin [Thermoleophilaceae bacterium]